MSSSGPKPADKLNFANAKHAGIKDYGSNCEFVLTPKGSAPVSQDAYAAFYSVLVTYRYPMRYLAQNQETIAKLTDDEKKLLESDELGFIREKFAKEFPQYAKEVNITTFPKSLYQLVAYYEDIRYLHDLDKQRKAIQTELDALPEFDPNFTRLSEQLNALPNTWEQNFKFNWEDEGYPTPFEDYCFTVLQSSNIHHYRVNQQVNTIREYVLTTMDTDNPARLIPLDEEIKQYIDYIISELKRVSDPFSDMLANDFLLKPDLQDKNLHVLQDIIALEWQSREKPNVNYVYQGKGQQIHKRTHNQDGYSDSFSDGVFGGGCHDADNGMAFAYIAGKKGAHIIDITEITKELTPQTEYHIYTPRVTTLINLHGNGELHHARSKISAKDYDFTKHLGIAPSIVSLGKDKLIFLHAPKNLDNQQTHEDLVNFLKENAVELFAKDHYTARRTFRISEEHALSTQKKVDFKNIHADIRTKKPFKK